MRVVKRAFVIATAAATAFLAQGCGKVTDTSASNPVASDPALAVALGSSTNPDLSKNQKQTEGGGISENGASSKTVMAESKWSYDSEEDKMRGRSRHFAHLVSVDMIQLEFPYAGGSDLRLMLRDDPEYGNDIIFILSKGQLPCSSYNGCAFWVKFDNGPIQRFGALGPEHGRGDTLFVDGSAGRKKFMKSIRKAKRMIVEVSVYNAGRQQFTFEPAGLKWERF